jgi:tetratricopeptide (TPR) repeat protein
MHMLCIARLKVMLVVGILLVTGCTSLQTGSDFQAGRQALLKGQNETALAYFQSAAQRDPAYSYGTAYKQNVLSYIGRSQYALGRLPEARQTLEKALRAKQDEDLTRLYLGLTLARSGDRQAGLKEIEDGMKGIHGWLDYINEAYRFSFGQYWDPARDIRSTIQGNLAMISSREFDWQKLIADSEWVAQRMEEEGDLARRNESQDRNRDSDNDTEP